MNKSTYSENLTNDFFKTLSVNTWMLQFLKKRKIPEDQMAPSH